MKEFLKNQIQFDHWANTELLASMKQADPLDERALILFSHLLSSSHMWLSRVKSEEITSTLFQERSLDGCEELLNENTLNWMAYIDQSNDEELKRVIQFTFPIDGTQKKMSVTNAIMHIVHHSSYHRGQIVSKLKGCVEVLPLVTYIVYAFENVD